MCGKEKNPTPAILLGIKSPVVQPSASYFTKRGIPANVIDVYVILIQEYITNNNIHREFN
jgi:hypothetical protein